jgi:molybdopterin/thiamine biosynthesis adenylyltransferase
MIDRAKAVVVGCGGVIGSHLVPHLARMEEMGRLALIDRDVYEAKNISCQNMCQKDIGKPKAQVQARRAREVNPGIRVEAIVDSLENVPMGRLQGDIIIGCLDNNRARLYLNQTSWHLGTVYLDSGVRGEGLLARVNVYVPGGEAPCLECAWDDRDYDRLELVHPCPGQGTRTAPTNSPSSLGALAASLQAIECAKILANPEGAKNGGRQVLIDASSNKQYHTTFSRNASCRFSHDMWQVNPLRVGPGQITVEKAFELHGERSERARTEVLRFEGVDRFVKRLRCRGCGWEKSLLFLEKQLTSGRLTCPGCSGRMEYAGFDLSEQIELGHLPPRIRKRTLRSLGFRPHDVFTIVGSSGTRHYEIAGHTDTRGGTPWTGSSHTG